MIELLNIDCIDYLLNLNRNIVIIGNEESKIKGMQQYLQKLLGSELQSIFNNSIICFIPYNTQLNFTF